MFKIMKYIFKTFLILFLILQKVCAEQQLSLIRDAEIEDFLYEISRPIFKSAKLNPNDIRFYIVNDNSINAFVMGGQNIFINTGTLINFDKPDGILGIIAHETGHIFAGHLARYNSETSSIQNISIGSILLGVGALLAGAPEVGQAVIFGGLQVGQQSILQYTRVQEEEADSLAIKFLHDNQLSASALLESMDKFYMEELQYEDQAEYYSTHPLSRNRRQFINDKMKNEKFSNNNFNSKYNREFNFIKAKILAYQKKQGQKIDIDLNSDYGKYAEAIINMNENKTKLALKNIDYLISKYINDPYFYELKGDIFLKENNVEGALRGYNIADKTLRNNTLIKKMIAFIIIKYEQKDMYQKAIDNLNFIIQLDSQDNVSFKLLAEAYFKNNEKAMSYLTLAKYYISLEYEKKVEKYLDMAKKETDDPNILRQIEDLKDSSDKKIFAPKLKK
ncbi:MAG TPA: M48 family metalloprotease [Rickettsiales bacterium]|nr:M48 family metalloprotease [Rickettsiales bacterium]